MSFVILLLQKRNRVAEPRTKRGVVGAEPDHVHEKSDAEGKRLYGAPLPFADQKSV